MRIAKIILALVAVALAAVGGVVVLAIVLTVGAIVVLTRLLTRGRARRLATRTPSPQSDAIDVTATEIPSDETAR